MSASSARRIIRLLGWLSAIMVALMLLTGYGISDFRVVTPLTFGLFNKATSMQLHETLAVPLIVLFIVHTGASYLSRRDGRRQDDGGKASR